LVLPQNILGNSPDEFTAREPPDPKLAALGAEFDYYLGIKPTGASRV